MNRHGIFSSARFQLALRLALFAALAQLALGFASAQHQARMLAAGPDAWEEICTPNGIEYVSLDALLDGAPADGNPAPFAAGQHCAVCAAATLDPLPASAPAPLPAPAAHPATTLPLPHHPPLAGALALRPPPRAPPLVS
jgi:hypothetical protein